MKFLIPIIACVAVYFAYTFNIYIGIIATIIFLVFLSKKIFPLVYKIKSRSAFSEGNYALAKSLYKKALKYNDDDAKSNIEYTYILLRAGEFEEAQRIMESVLSHKLDEKTRNVATLQRCMCYYKNGNLEEAYSDAEELYNSGYRSMTLYGLLGYFKLIKSPNSDETLDFCLEAYEYASDDRDICDNLLICYYNRGKYEKAKQISDDIISKNPKFIEAWYHAAQIDVALKDYKSAREKLDKIPECNRSAMTTIPIEDIDSLNNLVNRKLKEKN